MAGRSVAVKKYVVRLGEDQRRQLEEMVRNGKSPAQRLLKARILLKADVSESGEDWSDGKIIEALDTNAAMVYRLRKQLVEDGFEAALIREQQTTPTIREFSTGRKRATDQLGVEKEATGESTF